MAALAAFRSGTETIGSTDGDKNTHDDTYDDDFEESEEVIRTTFPAGGLGIGEEALRRKDERVELRVSMREDSRDQKSGVFEVAQPKASVPALRSPLARKKPSAAAAILFDTNSPNPLMKFHGLGATQNQEIGKEREQEIGKDKADIGLPGSGPVPARTGSAAGASAGSTSIQFYTITSKYFESVHAVVFIIPQQFLGISYDASDIGKVIQMFSFRFSSWEDVQILDFEELKMLHRCKNADGACQWMDLKQKPIRKKQ